MHFASLTKRHFFLLSKLQILPAGFKNHTRATVGSRKTETWYRYSDLRLLAEPLKATAEKCGCKLVRLSTTNFV